MTLKYHKHVQAIIDETGLADPREAIRLKARNKIAELEPLFESPPYDLAAFASCVGLYSSEEAPAYSKDSEIVPTSDGRVVLRVNHDRPVTRQRFSIAHEIGHTFFPEYQFTVQCRNATERRWNDDDLLESLCDVAASEIMFPLKWFQGKMNETPFTGHAISSLAEECLASREATARRFVEVAKEPLAAVFFSWRLKPLEERQLTRDARQPLLFADLAPNSPVAKLRVDYAVMNEMYRTGNYAHIPRHKSIEHEGPIYKASTEQVETDGTSMLRFGKSDSTFQVVAFPIFTEDFSLGPEDASSVVAILRPLD